MIPRIQLTFAVRVLRRIFQDDISESGPPKKTGDHHLHKGTLVRSLVKRGVLYDHY